MKYTVGLFMVGILIPSILFGQVEQEEVLSKRDRIQAQKVAQLTLVVKLTPEESQKFWPIYNQMDEELHATRMERRASHKSYRDGYKELSEEDLDKLLDKEFDARQKELTIRRNYHEQFKQLIGVHKTARLYQAERDFQKELIRGVREKAQRTRHGRDSGQH
jgi:hypothetical protein